MQAIFDVIDGTEVLASYGRTPYPEQEGRVVRDIPGTFKGTPGEWRWDEASQSLQPYSPKIFSKREGYHRLMQTQPILAGLVSLLEQKQVLTTDELLDFVQDYTPPSRGVFSTKKEMR